MTLPAPYQFIFDQWKNQGIQVMGANWTTSLQRHVGVQVKYHGSRGYAKLTLANNRDLDEPDMLGGMRREVWWSQVIERLRQENSSFPFTSPRVLETNANQQPFQEEVAWVIMEYIDGAPIVNWETEQTQRRLIDSEEERLNLLFDVAIASLLALEQVHPQTLQQLGLPELPAPPHGMRRWQKKGILKMPMAVLGNGAFEIENFWRTPDGTLVIIDNEFAGWYPKYDHLSYLYHRLYCNTMRPDLAKRMLGDYMQETMRRGDLNESTDSLCGFYKRFANILKPRLLSGWYYDTFRRKLPLWHKKQRLRYGLYLTLLDGKYDSLISPHDSHE